MSSKTTYNNNDDEDAAAIDRLSQLNTHQNVEQPWLTDAASARAARLQANDVNDDAERSRRRNDALFLGKLLMIVIRVSLTRLISVETRRRKK